MSATQIVQEFNRSYVLRAQKELAAKPPLPEHGLPNWNNSGKSTLHFCGVQNPGGRELQIICNLVV
jgi:hypothetical protein